MRTPSRRYQARPFIIEAYRTFKTEAITTAEGSVQIAKPGDYVLGAATGNKIVCTADIFAQTYEPTDDFIPCECTGPSDCGHQPHGNNGRCEACSTRRHCGCGYIHALSEGHLRGVPIPMIDRPSPVK